MDRFLQVAFTLVSCLKPPGVGFRRPRRFRAWSTPLFLLYTAELLDLMWDQGMKAHSYADWHAGTCANALETDRRRDSWPEVQTDSTETDRDPGWAATDRRWMQTERRWHGQDPDRQTWQTDRHHRSSRQTDRQTFYFPPQYPDLGVHLDRQLTMTGSCGRQCAARVSFRQRQTDRPSGVHWQTDADKTLAQTFVGGQTWLLQQTTVQCQTENACDVWQSVQNATAQFITGTRTDRSDHDSVAQTPLVASADKGQIFKISHSDVPMFDMDRRLLIWQTDSTVVSDETRSETDSDQPPQGRQYRPRTRTVTFGPRSFKVRQTRQSGTIFPLGW